MRRCSTMFILFLMVYLQNTVDSRQVTQNEFNSIQENYILPNNEIFLQLGLFLFLSFLFVYPPDVVVGVGATLENMAASYLGNSDPDIMQYQSRRVVVNRAFIGCLPFLFSLYMFLSKEHALIFAAHPTRFIHYFANFSVLLLITSFFYWMYHHITDFRNLGAVKRMLKYDTNLKQLYTHIATEMLAMDTFKHVISSSSRLIVSQRWLIYYTKFDFVVYRVEELSFSVTSAEDILVNPLNPEGAIQLITMKIDVPPHLGSHIVFKLHNLILQDLQSTLTRPIEIPPSVVLKLSTVERFARVFADEVAKNPVYTIDQQQELEPCLACSETISNMKITKRCGDVMGEEGAPRCHSCNCRPMWCVLCMGKVFAAKQDQDRPGSWLMGKAPCPTCRAVFCVFDVSMVQVKSTDE